VCVRVCVYVFVFVCVRECVCVCMCAFKNADITKSKKSVRITCILTFMMILLKSTFKAHILNIYPNARVQHTCSNVAAKIYL